jgi:hypothetical protein
LKSTLQTERLLERVASIKAELAATQGLDVSAEEQRQLLAQLQIVAARKRFEWRGAALSVESELGLFLSCTFHKNKSRLLCVPCREILAKFQVASDAAAPAAPRS